MKQKLFPTMLIVITTGLLLLTACGDTSPPAPVNITIEMAEFSYSIHEFDLMDLKVGQEVTLKLVNIGLLEHEIMFGRNMVAGGNGMPMGYEIDFFDQAGVEPTLEITEEVHQDDHGEETHADDLSEEEMDHAEEVADHDGDDDGEHEHSGFMVTLAPGADGYTIQFTITEEMIGEWEIGCFLLEGVHYAQGMFLEMKVSS